MSHQWSRELTTAGEAVQQAAAVCRRIQADLSAVALEKQDRSPVTIADFASQALICRRLAEVFPEDAIVAEEDSSQLKTDDQQKFLPQIQHQLQQLGWTATHEEICTTIDRGNADGSQSRFWTLDPIDGTKGFLRGDQYAIALALIVDGLVRVAALACPQFTWEGRQGAILTAARAQGAFVRPDDQDSIPEPIRVSNVTSTRQTRFCESVETAHSRHDWSARIAEKLEIAADPVRIDSQAKYAAVAVGQAEVYLRLPTRPGYREKIWDHAAGTLIVEEAGGRVTDIHGVPLDFARGFELEQNQGVLASNAALHTPLLQAIKATAEE